MNEQINPLMIARLCSEPWLVQSAVLDAIAADPLAFIRMYGMPDSGKNAGDKKPEPYTAENGIAIIRAEGVMMNKWGADVCSCGIVSTDKFESAVRAATTDAAVAGIFLLMDSPGGMATGIPEAADAVLQAKQIKPVVAYNDGMMDSAAYWIGSQASSVFSTQSARTGSIGAYLAFMDFSKLAAQMGISVEVIRSAPHKGMGMPGTSLTEEDRAALQSRIDKLGAEFVATVQAARGGNVDPVCFSGLDFDAGQATNAGLIDGVMTRGEALAKLYAATQGQEVTR